MAAADALLELGVEARRIHEGFNAVDVDRFAAVAQVAPTGGGHRYLYVGQLIERKNVDGLLRAFAICARAEDTLTIVGAGERLNHLKELAKSLSTSDAIQFVGEVSYDALPTVLSAHHTLVLPSTEEVWGLVVNEALAAGRHVVVSERAGVQRSVESMPGTFSCAVGVRSIADSLVASRAAWRGPIAPHPMLGNSPQKFASIFLDALGFQR
ncbi:glycosyltransferase [Microbacterium plantarum]|uniref:glycosyltransferase n=1 Tax=Microbacterium plantarum TaxID=1816425 RepID=UPI002B47F4B8|nr:glycosyltransferase [Microbacterium plantarum]WRK16917.1 glycosyltransferase [Microbacterium plantarum]